MTIQQFLDLTISKNASDLHFLVGDVPMLRVNGELARIETLGEMTESEFDSLIIPLLTPFQKDVLEKNWELDFGMDFERKARFRINIYKQKGHLAAAFRLIPNSIRKIETLGLPASIKKITELHQGLVLVTGPTGHGKTTTLASFINEINNTRSSHIITIEDPIEFIFPKGKSLISQRELNSDTKTWNNALRAVLREDPDVVLVGELRDYETMAAAMTIAETGHLVFATLHTNSSSQTIDRIIDVFPVNQQEQIRIQLASVLEAVISQRLIPTINPGRVMSFEIMYGTPALRSIIRDDKSHLIDNMILTSGEWGMVLMEASLATLVREGKISSETALNYSIRPQMMNKMLGGNTHQYA